MPLEIAIEIKPRPQWVARAWVLDSCRPTFPTSPRRAAPILCLSHTLLCPPLTSIVVTGKDSLQLMSLRMFCLPPPLKFSNRLFSRLPVTVISNIDQSPQADSNSSKQWWHLNRVKPVNWRARCYETQKRQVSETGQVKKWFSDQPTTLFSFASDQLSFYLDLFFCTLSSFQNIFIYINLNQ